MIMYTAPTLASAARLAYVGPTLAGHLVSWRVPLAGVPVTGLRAALANAGLHAGTYAPDLTPEQRVTRVAAAVARDDSMMNGSRRITRRVRRGVRQVTREEFTGWTDEVPTLAYAKENAIRYDEGTDSVVAEDGRDITLTDLTVRDTRTPADVGSIVRAIIRNRGRDLIPVREQGGVYFVPANDQTGALIETLAKFLIAVGGRLSAFACVLGSSPTEDASIASTVADYLTGQMNELRQAIADVTGETRKDVTTRRFAEIGEIRQRLTAYAGLLAGQAEQLTAEVEATEALLLERMADGQLSIV